MPLLFIPACINAAVHRLTKRRAFLLIARSSTRGKATVYTIHSPFSSFSYSYVPLPSIDVAS